MKATNMKDRDYSSFYFVALLDNNKTLKCHWYNKAYSDKNGPLNNEYYFNFIENCSVEGLKKILPTAKKAVQNCSGYLKMEGIDYNELASQKHKIYICGAKNTYDGLIKTYSASEELVKKLKILTELQ